MTTELDIKNALAKVSAKYSKIHAQYLERLYRNETRHFKSGNFLITNAPGMEAFSNNFPYGWTSLKSFWSENPLYAPIRLHEQIENTSALASASKKPKRFLVFANIEASMFTVAELIKIRGGNFGSYFANDVSLQIGYVKELDKIKSRLV